MKRWILATALLTITANPAASQVVAEAGSTISAIRVFLDCQTRCDRDFLRLEIPAVDWVNDRQVSDVHVLVTRERGGGGGSVYQLNFIGRRAFEALSDTLTYSTQATATDDERRRSMSRMMKLGLIRYLARTQRASNVDVTFAEVLGQESAAQTTNGDDPWNAWVFQVGGNTYIRAEESSESIFVRGEIEADRTTEVWNIRTSLNGSRDEDNFTFTTDSGRDTTVTSVRSDARLRGVFIKSLTNHWSAGLFSNANTSSRRNTDAAYSVGPSVEYNIFPYSQARSREFRLQYHFRYEGVWYDEVTIFDQTRERFLKHSLEARLDLQQVWGGAEFRAELDHFLTNFEESKTEFYSLRIGAEAEIRIIRGLSLDFNVDYSIIDDQLYLRGDIATEEDVLLGTVSLPTSYEFSMGVGISYRFGSIYNNVVNPRFGY